MRGLPNSARAIQLVVYACGGAAIAGAYLAPAPPHQASGWELVLFAVLAAVAGRARLRIPGTGPSNDAVPLGFAIVLAAILRLGPVAGIAVGVLSATAGSVYPTRQPLNRALFSIALGAAECWICGWTFLLVNGGSLGLGTLQSWGAGAVACLGFCLLDTLGTALTSCPPEGAPTVSWTASIPRIVAAYVAATFATFTALILFGRWAGTALLFASPVAYLAYQSYSLYREKTIEGRRHMEELQTSQGHLADLYLATIKSLALAIDAKDQYTSKHILRVQRYAVATATKMGLDGPDLEAVTTGALLHDIGKLGVPEYLLLKPGRLTEEEYAKIRKHPEIGAAILDPVDFPWPVLPVVKYHHEKWDGSGYPDGLRGEDIPLTARVLAVSDVYDALTSQRSYRAAWTHERALQVIQAGAGVHFDPAVVEAFMAVVDGVVAEMKRECRTAAFDSGKSSHIGAGDKSEQAVSDIQRASSELWALYEVAQTLSASLGLRETLDILARKLEAIMPGTACVFMLREEDSDRLIARAAVGVNREFFAGCRTLGAISRSVRTMRSRETYCGTYETDDMMLRSSQLSEWTRLSTALIAPIIHEDEPLGTINLYHPEPDAFTPHDRQFLETIAERAATAIYNGLLFDRTRSHAMRDPLTGLYNLRYLTEHVDGRCIASGGLHLSQAEALRGWRREHAFALLCLDLDSFKPINDNFGHHRGDKVLRDLSALLQEMTRDQDIVARYGSDEFLIVLNEAGPEEAEDMAQRIQNAVADYDPELHHPRLGGIRIGVSVGYACFPMDGRDCATLLVAADSRMYGDKTERKLGLIAEQPLPEPQISIRAA